MKQISKKVLITLLIVLLLACMAGCRQPAPESAPEGQAPPPGNEETAGEAAAATASLVEELQSKYENQGDFEYAEPLWNQRRDVSFEFKSDLGPEYFDIEGYGYSRDFSKLVNVFIDSNFTISAEPLIDYSEDNSAYIVNPPAFAPLAPTKIDDRFYESYSPWGLASQYFLVRYYDLETGEELDKPIVTVFDIAPEAGAPDAPFLEFRKSDTGFASFTWNEVPGADRYHIYYMGDSATIMNIPFAEGVTDTFATGGEVDNLGGYTLINMLFREEFGYKYFYAFAEKDGMLSPASNLVSIDSIRSALVYSFDTGNEDFRVRIKDLNELPGFLPVRMCDDSVVMYPVSYDLDEYTVQSMMDVYGRQIGDLDMSQVFGTVPVTADGTEISIVMFFDNYQDPDFEQNLRETVEKLDGQKNRAGADRPISVSRESEQNQKSGVQDTPIVIPDEFPVFAYSALSEYLAINMLSGNEKIDISMFNEASDLDYLLDCFMEAYYQNPLILMVDGLDISRDGSTLFVIYGQTQQEQARKQEEIKQEVKTIVGQIIKGDMTDLEKEIAINNYLCESAEYDYDALENAMENDMMPDKKFDDSFTAYGILVNKVGVCASYAASFKLLADMSGLDSIVVTGYLNGYLPHAWNRASVNDEWMTLDVTNNDNPELFNALLNLWDDVSTMVLVEDRDYVLDSELYRFTAQNDEIEYYRQNDQYYPVSEIGGKLAEGLDKDGIVTLRTSEYLTTEEFMMILADVADSPVFKGREQELDNVEVYEFMGCITLKYT